MPFIGEIIMKTYVTFGFDHAHAINGKTFDKDCVAVIESESAENGVNWLLCILAVDSAWSIQRINSGSIQ